MRRSTAIMMGILVVAFGGLLLAGNSMLGPLAHDAEVAKSLTTWLRGRGDLPPEARVRALRLKGGGGRLAEAGFGLLVELEPSASLATRAGGLASTALLLTEECLPRYPRGQIDWVEVVYVLGGEDAGPWPERPRVRALLTVDEVGRIAAPRPALPERLPVLRGRAAPPPEPGATARG